MMSRILLAVTALLILGGSLAYFVVVHDRDRLPQGFVEGNGRLEAEQVEIAPKIAGRVDRVLAAEGSLVGIVRGTFWILDLGADPQLSIGKILEISKVARFQFGVRTK